MSYLFGRGDYKYRIQMEAEERADRQFGRDYFELSESTRDRLYAEAMAVETERLVDRADWLKDQAKEGPCG